MASRSTFREMVHGVAWQKQIRDRYLAEGAPPVPHLDVKRAMVRSVSRRLAEQVILKYEWLGTMAPTTYHYGIFFGDFCAGVCCLGTRAAGSPSQHEQFAVGPDTVGVLARGACVHWAPRASNSKLISWTARLIRHDDPRLKLLLAYSDTDAGEIGTVYQACNWIYIGTTGAGVQFVSPTGRIYHSKILYDLCRRAGYSKGRKPQKDARRWLLANGWREEAINSKHKYVVVLDKTDKQLVARVDQMRQAYPKRPASIDGDASAHHVGEGGSIPTAGLHKIKLGP
jgi:hypothetical protein